MDQQQPSNCELMLAIAREAIQRRAARDGYEAGAYDAEHDPEGYVTSLLNALQRWGRRCGIDWHRELTMAQAFFEEDEREADRPDATPLPPPVVAELRCPKCGQANGFVIEVIERPLMFADGTVLQEDAGRYWGDWSYCRCNACQHTGTVYQFRPSHPNAEQKGGPSDG